MGHAPKKEMNPGRCQRGDVVLVAFDHAAGLEQDTFQALVISCDTTNDSLETAIICPFVECDQLSESTVGAVFIPKGMLGFEQNHIVLCLQIQTIFKEQIINQIGALPDSMMSTVRRSLKTVLHLD